MPDEPGWGDNLERVLVIVFLGVTALVSVGGALWLSAAGEQTPDMLQILGAAAIGSLGGLLSGGPR